MPLFLRLTRTIVGVLATTRVPIKLEPERSGNARLKIRSYSTLLSECLISINLREKLGITVESMDVLYVKLNLQCL